VLLHAISLNPAMVFEDELESPAPPKLPPAEEVQEEQLEPFDHVAPPTIPDQNNPALLDGGFVRVDELSWPLETAEPITVPSGLV
jgi:hypothetical protein